MCLFFFLQPLPTKFQTGGPEGNGSEMPRAKVAIRCGGDCGGGAAIPPAKVAIKCENCLEKKLERTETEEGFAWVCSRFKR